MTITTEMMRAASQTGLSVVCSSCEKYWEARDKGIPGDACTANRCGSPLAGGEFSEYRGRITLEAFSAFCFVCGSASVRGLAKEGSRRVIGVCAKHFVWMSDPEMRSPRPIFVSGPPKNYLGLDAADLDGYALPPEASLAGQMLLTEKGWADSLSTPFDPLALLGVRREGD